MHPENRRARRAQQCRRRACRDIAILCLTPCRVADEPFAAGADEKRKAKYMQFVEPRHQFEIFRGILCETETRVENDLFGQNTGA